jgi:hypothetical protein
VCLLSSTVTKSTMYSLLLLLTLTLTLSQVRAALRTLWSAALHGSVQQVADAVQCAIHHQQRHRQTQRAAPWAPVGLDDKTPLQGLAPLHCAVVGAAARLR